MERTISVQVTQKIQFFSSRCGRENSTTSGMAMEGISIRYLPCLVTAMRGHGGGGHCLEGRVGIFAESGSDEAGVFCAGTERAPGGSAAARGVDCATTTLVA